jgi:hypothetical protein
MIKKDRILISTLIVWTFTHTYLLITNINTTEIRNFRIVDQQLYNHIPTDYFYPFTSRQNFAISSSWAIDFYDYTEYFVYVIGAWALFFIYKLLYKEEELK